MVRRWTILNHPTNQILKMKTKLYNEQKNLVASPAEPCRPSYERVKLTTARSNGWLRPFTPTTCRIQSTDWEILEVILTGCIKLAPGPTMCLSIFNCISPSLIHGDCCGNDDRIIVFTYFGRWRGSPEIDWDLKLPQNVEITTTSHQDKLWLHSYQHSVVSTWRHIVYCNRKIKSLNRKNFLLVETHIL